MGRKPAGDQACVKNGEGCKDAVACCPVVQGFEEDAHNH